MIDLNYNQFKKYREMEYRDLIMEFIKLLQPRVYCEIGVKRGYTFKTIISEVDMCIGVDPIPLSNIERFANVKFYAMFSSQFAEVYDGPKFDMLFIDGDHSEEGLYHDITKIAIKFIQPITGLIFVHDTYPVEQKLEVPGYCDKAWKVAKLIHDYPSLNLEIVTIPGPWAGLSILRYVPNGQHLHWK